MTWPLTSPGTLVGNSSQPSLATGAAQIINGGPHPTIFVHDYWNGQAQRMKTGTSGWIAGPALPDRYLQFDAQPTPGNQLKINSVSFNYGGAGMTGHIHASVRYSVNNWISSTLITNGLAYPSTAMPTYSGSISAPPVPPGGKFSLRIHPAASQNSVAMAITFASHSNIVLNGTSTPLDNKGATFTIRKNTGPRMVPGTYVFNITCSGQGGPYTGGPVAVVLPSPGMATVNVPAGAICGVTEVPPAGGGWAPPGFSGNALQVGTGGPWEAKVGPVNGSAGSLIVSNRPGHDDDKVARFTISKRTGERMVPGTYLFTISCGPNGPYTGPNPVAVVLPSPGMSSVSVPAGSICGIIETPPSGGNWAAPDFHASGVNLQMGAPWQAKVGPVNGHGGAVVVNNKPGKDDGKLVGFTLHKRIEGGMVPGTYLFALTCNGPNGPFNTSASVVLPTPGMSTVQVPAGSVCRIVEQTPSGGGWGLPGFTANGMQLEMGGGWEAKFGPVNQSGNSVMVSNRRGKPDGKTVRFNIRKSTGERVIAGTYYFNLSCSGPGGPYTGINPVPVVLPNPGVTTVSVPAGSMCNLTEQTPATGNWLAPTYTGNGVNVQTGGGWEAKVGPLNDNHGTVLVTNKPGKDDGKLVGFTLHKRIEGGMVPGTYLFALTCNGPNGPFNTSASVVLPTPGMSTVQVPAGSVCRIVEQTPSGGGWGLPGFTANGMQLEMGGGWEAKFGPVNQSGNSVMVSNRRGKPDGKTVRFNIRKSTGERVIAGTYYFDLSCSGPGGPYTGINPVPVVLPSPGVSTVSVPA
ncbi:MAG: DUF5979 domain-containing protein, partial [Pseudomonadota bacterium]